MSSQFLILGPWVRIPQGAPNSLVNSNYFGTVIRSG
jgi:hypothetical protein